MTLKENTLTLGLIGITLVDALGSISSRILVFDYFYIGPFSLMVYGLVGFITARERNLKQAIVSTSILGLFDSTAGWLIMNRLEANVVGWNREIYSPGLFFAMIFLMILFGGIVGLISGGVGLLFKRN
jgi:hypothetical protein